MTCPREQCCAIRKKFLACCAPTESWPRSDRGLSDGQTNAAPCHWQLHGPGFAREGTNLSQRFQRAAELVVDSLGTQVMGDLGAGSGLIDYFGCAASAGTPLYVLGR